MTVPVYRRNPTDKLLEIQKKSYQLYGYITNTIFQNKSFKHEKMKYISQKLQDCTFNFCRLIDTANKFNLFDDFESQQRLIHQREALGYLTSLKSSIYCAYNTNKFRSKKLIFWFNNIQEIEKLLNNWIKSDKQRKLQKN